MTEVRDRYVYILEDIGGTPYYVGIGKGDRMWHHFRRAHYDFARGRNTEKNAFIVRNIQFGGPPDPYKAAENLTISEAVEIEIRLIKQIGRRDLGTGPLFNQSAGGFGIKQPSAATREKQSASQRARWTDADRKAWGEKIRASLTPEMKAQFAAQLRKASSTPQARQAQADALSRRWSSPVARKQLSIRLTGHAVSDDTRASIGAKARLRMSDPARREAQSQLTARQMSEPSARKNLSEKAAAQWTDPESRAKKLAGMKASWARRKKVTSEAGAPA